MSRYRACLLCGSESQELVFLVVRWRKPIGNQVFGSIPRCVDRTSCRTRVESQPDGVWEVLDAGDPLPTTERERPPLTAMRPVEAPPAHALEDVFA